MKTYNVVALSVISSLALAACGSGAASQHPRSKSVGLSGVVSICW